MMMVAVDRYTAVPQQLSLIVPSGGDAELDRLDR